MSPLMKVEVTPFGGRVDGLLAGAVDADGPAEAAVGVEVGGVIGVRLRCAAFSICLSSWLIRV